MRHFRDGDTIYIEPWRAQAFPVIKDLVVDRSSFDRIIQAGGFISVSTGTAPEANSVPVPKPSADLSMDASEELRARSGTDAEIARFRAEADALFAK